MIKLTALESGHDSYTVRIAGPELIAALFRKVLMQEITQADAERAAANFKADFRAQYQVIEITTGLADQAMRLAEKHGLRGYDAVHLAAAVKLQTVRVEMELPPMIFVSADDELNAAAQEEGLSIDNPNTHI